MRKKPPLKSNEAILSCDTRFGYRDYFHVKIKKQEGKLVPSLSDIDIDEWIEYIKEELHVDYSDEVVTGYCKPGFSLRKWYKNQVNYERII